MIVGRTMKKIIIPVLPMIMIGLIFQSTPINGARISKRIGHPTVGKKQQKESPSAPIPTTSQEQQKEGQNILVNAIKKHINTFNRKMKKYFRCLTFGSCKEKEINELKTAATAILATIALVSLATWTKANSLLLAAAKRNSLSGVKAALKLGAHVNAQDAFGKTAFMFSIEKRNGQIAQLLYEEGADPAIKDKNGYDAKWYGEAFLQEIIKP